MSPPLDPCIPHIEPRCDGFRILPNEALKPLRGLTEAGEKFDRLVYINDVISRYAPLCVSRDL